MPELVSHQFVAVSIPRPGRGPCGPPLQTKGPPVPRYPGPSRPIWHTASPESFTAGKGWLRRAASLPRCDPIWVNALSSPPGWPAPGQVRNDFKEQRPRPSLGHKSHPAEKVPCWEEPLALSSLIVLVSPSPAP